MVQKAKLSNYPNTIIVVELKPRLRKLCVLYFL